MAAAAAAAAAAARLLAGIAGPDLPVPGGWERGRGPPESPMNKQLNKTEQL